MNKRRSTPRLTVKLPSDWLQENALDVAARDE